MSLLPWKEFSVHRTLAETVSKSSDILAEEAPLEIRLMPAAEKTWEPYPLSVTMRSPGADDCLTLGFLYTEGIIDRYDEVERLELQAPGKGDDQLVTRMDVVLSERSGFTPQKVSRHFYMASSCGICGKPGMDQVCQEFLFLTIPGRPGININDLLSLPERIQGKATLFEKTGGVHAAYLLDSALQFLDCQEDIGRHNALDKLIGKQLLAGHLPLDNHVVLLSGRISFELVQKALRAGISTLVAFGAASAGAVRLAEVHGMTLIGFLKPDRMNVYCDVGRLIK
jgi:FdhD protein